jgi:hypothetical protein
MTWLGRKKLAFIPLSRTNIQPPDIVPPDWPDLIMQRLFFDPPTDPTTGNPVSGTDRSVRAYFHTVSSGLADLDVVVLPAQTIAEENVPPDALEATMGAQLRAEGFVGAAIVMLGGPGGGSTAPLSNFAWSRFCMSDDLGAWVGEILHQTNLCNLPDLFDFAGEYPSDENMGPFDQEAGYEATHLSAWTKRAVGWLDPSTVSAHPGGVAEYTLHSVSLIQPPPTGRIAAVQIGAEVPYLMVEARLQADQFDINIPNEGVIVYRVQTTDPLGNAQNDTAPLALLTKTALTAGQSFTADGATIDVGVAVLGGGFSIQVEAPPFENGRIYAVDQNGQLLSYGDDGTPGNVSDPVVVGFDGWLEFKFLFGGGNLAGENRIYAVNQNGQLLSYGDTGTPGNVSDPVVVGNDEWLEFKFLFAGKNLFGENRIYAVNQNGQLLSYGDDGTPGNVSDPVVVGFGGWLEFTFLFAGRNLAGENCIYAVNQNGQLLSYGDAGTPGNVADPVVVGFGGWLEFKFLFAGRNVSGEYRIYAVNQNGQLLSYGDAGTPGNVSDPVVVGSGGWLAFKFLFGGAVAA